LFGAWSARAAGGIPIRVLEGLKMNVARHNYPKYLIGNRVNYAIKFTKKTAI